MIVTNARYHRNGISGAGFYALTLRVTERRQKRTLQAIVFDEDGHVAVLNEDGEAYRCQDYEDELRAFIDSPACHRLAWPETAHLIPCNEA